MKQHITKKQLNELSEKGKKRLSDYADRKNMEGQESGIYWYTRYLPLLSLGPMIEFLSKEGINIDLCFPEEFFINEQRYETKELCDALFEAVKEILEK